MKNKNILELCLSPGLGGLELFVVSCYKDFSKKTHCIVAVAPDQKLDSHLNIENKCHIKRNKFLPFLAAYKLAKHIDENDIDIIHFHWTRDIITAVLAKKFSTKKPKIIQSRHMGMTRFKNDLYHKWIYKNIDLIHSVTYKVQEQIEKFISKDVRPKVKTVYLGTKSSTIDKEIVASLQKKYNEKNDFIVGIVGRIEEGKGQHILIDAMFKLKDLNVKCLIVGSAMDEKYLKYLKQKVEDLGLSEKIIFTGFTTNVNEFMQTFDVNILATENETFGLVVIEAMVNRVAMIATNKGGPLEIIQDGIDGLLFNRSPEELFEKITLLYNDENLKNNLVNAAYEKVQNKFDMDTQMKKIYELMNES